MNTPHLPSLGLGILSGLIVLVVISAGLHLAAAPSTSAAAAGRAPNLTRMAQRFGMTEADLQKEMADGKTLQQIAQEHGVTFGGRGGQGGGAQNFGGGVNQANPNPPSGSASS